MKRLMNALFKYSLVLVGVIFLVPSIAAAINSPLNVFAKVTMGDGSAVPAASAITIKVTDKNNQTVTYQNGTDPSSVISYQVSSGAGIITIAMANFTAQWATGDLLTINVTSGAYTANTSTNLTGATQTFANDTKLNLSMTTGGSTTTTTTTTTTTAAATTTTAVATTTTAAATTTTAAATTTTAAATTTTAAATTTTAAATTTTAAATTTTAAATTTTAAATTTTTKATTTTTTAATTTTAPATTTTTAATTTTAPATTTTTAATTTTKATTTTTTTSATTTTTCPQFSQGDANGDGTINVYDALYVAKYDVGKVPDSEIAARFCTVANWVTVANLDNGGVSSGKVDIYDALAIAIKALTPVATKTHTVMDQLAIAIKAIVPAS